jgi:hypothetical protein
MRLDGFRNGALPDRESSPSPHPSNVERSPTEAYTMKSTSGRMESTYCAVPITTSPSWGALTIATLTMQSDPSHRE